MKNLVLGLLATVLSLVTAHTQTAEWVAMTTKGNPSVIVAEQPAFLIPNAPLTFKRPATYIGGQQAIQTVIDRHMAYPEKAQEYAVEGTVEVQFSIDRNGQVTSTTITQSLGFGCDEEALRLAEFLTDWVPAQLGPNLVQSNFYLPIRFSLL